MTPAERDAMIARYAEGPALLRQALSEVPAAAMKWRPGPGRWSAHEVILHCADSETNSHMRIRYLVAEPEPLIVGYDQDAWARIFDYHSLPLDLALATIDAVRANTVPLLRRLTEADWQKKGRHTESGSYSGDRWLEVYADHLEVHARQLRRNVAAWNEQKG
ncbi:MAG: DinB family protein [Gemmatimonadales bacterium]